MEFVDKIVEFDKYCSKCKYENLNGDGEPCNTCLTNPTNTHSKKPVCFEEKPARKRTIKFVRRSKKQNKSENLK